MRRTVSELENPVMRVLEAYKASVHAKDVDAFVALYDQDVCVFDMWGQWSYQGVGAWRGMVTDWFGSLGADKVVVEVDEVQNIVAPDFAVVHAMVTYQRVSAQGDKLRAMPNRLTWVLRREAGAWKIVHEHTSAPVDHKTSKVILEH